jgi:hypothetical protein
MHKNQTGLVHVPVSVLPVLQFERTGRPHVLVPTTFEPGKEGTFWLTARCEGGLEYIEAWSGNLN